MRWTRLDRRRGNVILRDASPAILGPSPRIGLLSWSVPTALRMFDDRRRRNGSEHQTVVYAAVPGGALAR